MNIYFKGIYMRIRSEELLDLDKIFIFRALLTILSEKFVEVISLDKGSIL